MIVMSDDDKPVIYTRSKFILHFFVLLLLLLRNII